MRGAARKILFQTVASIRNGTGALGWAKIEFSFLAIPVLRVAALGRLKPDLLRPEIGFLPRRTLREVSLDLFKRAGRADRFERIRFFRPALWRALFLLAAARLRF